MTHTDWGTVPAWLSAILTGGSLLLGFYILLRDRRKEERQEALKVNCWSVMANNSDYDVHVLNTSDRPVTYAQMLIYMSSHEGVERVGVGDGSAIRPGEEVTAQCPRHMNNAKSWPAAIEFQDADGITWVREITDGALHRRRKEQPTFLRVLFGRHGGWAAAMRARRYRQLLRG
ncbi:hypothetical protein [Streptomyces sp. NPDC056512]|uniref:hypothetical protein n=1 Tax=Streptomyces sp. NPDC056512 TaxID=3345846 RepID=UPI0036863510